MNDITKMNQSIKLQETPIFLKSGFSGVPFNRSTQSDDQFAFDSK